MQAPNSFGSAPDLKKCLKLLKEMFKAFSNGHLPNHKSCICKQSYEIPQKSLRQWTLDPSENKLKSLWNGSLAADRAPKKIVM